jgi:hypothetical protein
MKRSLFKSKSDLLNYVGSFVDKYHGAAYNYWKIPLLPIWVLNWIRVDYLKN